MCGTCYMPGNVPGAAHVGVKTDQVSVFSARKKKRLNKHTYKIIRFLFTMRLVRQGAVMKHKGETVFGKWSGR